MRLLRINLLGLIYLIAGVVVAATHHYFRNLQQPAADRPRGTSNSPLAARPAGRGPPHPPLAQSALARWPQERLGPPCSVGRAAMLSVMSHREQHDTGDKCRGQPPSGVKQNHRSRREDHDRASHGDVSTFVSRLRINSSVSLSFNGTALVSSQSWASSAFGAPARSTEPSSSSLPPTAAMWYSRAIASQRSCHQHVYDEHHGDPSDPDTAPKHRHARDYPSSRARKRAVARVLPHFAGFLRRRWAYQGSARTLVAKSL
jgi:hypothetical protein